MEKQQHSPKPTPRLEPWAQLDKKIVLVTGASSGLGRVFCLDLARAGCRIVAAARRVDRLKSLCEEINRLENSSGTACKRAVAVELDISSAGSVIEPAIKMAWDAFGGIDALVNNAGVRGEHTTITSDHMKQREAEVTSKPVDINENLQILSEVLSGNPNVGQLSIKLNCNSTPDTDQE